MVMIVVAAWVMGSLFNVFSSGLEGFQRFDLINKIYLVGVRAVKSFGTAALLLLPGYGVLEMADRWCWWRRSWCTCSVIWRSGTSSGHFGFRAVREAVGAPHHALLRRA